MKTLALLLAFASISLAQEVSPSDADLQALIAYGQQWRTPDKLYDGGLPHSARIEISGMRTLIVMDDRANICLEACRAKMLLKSFGVAEARRLFNPNRLHAVLEVASMTVSGALNARDNFGRNDINLIILLNDQQIQPVYVSGAHSETASGIQVGTINTAGNFAFVNTLALAPGLLTRAFAFEIPAIPAKAGFILVQSDGKKQQFEGSLLDLKQRLDDIARIRLQYPNDLTVKAGSPAKLRFSFCDLNGKVTLRATIVQAESIWKTGKTPTEDRVKVKEIQAPAVCSFKRNFEEGGIYEFSAPTDGLAPGTYELLFRAGMRLVSLPFRVR